MAHDSHGDKITRIVPLSPWLVFRIALGLPIDLVLCEWVSFIKFKAMIWIQQKRKHEVMYKLGKEPRVTWTKAECTPH